MNDTVSILAIDLEYSLICPECDAYMDLIHVEQNKLLAKSIHDYCCPLCHKMTILHTLDI